jgi:hypothetical protein
VFSEYAHSFYCCLCGEHTATHEDTFNGLLYCNACKQNEEDKMYRFPEATENKLYKIEGLDGLYLKVKYSEAKDLPEGVRASLNGRICWFVPEAFNYNEIQED